MEFYSGFCLVLVLVLTWYSLVLVSKLVLVNLTLTCLTGVSKWSQLCMSHGVCLVQSLCKVNLRDYP